MQITHWQMEPHEETTEVSAEVDGFRLWYRVPKSYAVCQTADPFLAAALLPAMLRGEPLEIDPGLPVSPRLLAHVATLQEIHHCWNPIFQKIPISARTCPAEPLNEGTLSFFSGGVDSTYTFLKRAGEITHAVFLHGFDFYVDAHTYEVAMARNTAFVSSFGKTLIPIQMNHHPFGYRYNLSRNLTQGSALASVALLLGFPRVYVPSSYSYDQLIPLGSHPLTDPLWSSDSVTIIHDGAETRRVDKVKAIAGSAAALANLRVCFDDMNANCGRCVKCVRTMIPLRLLQAQGPFPPLPSLSVIGKLHVDPIDRIFLAENVALAQQSQDRALRKALLSCLHRCERRVLLKEVDRVFWGGFLRRLYRRHQIARLGPPRINATPEGA